MAGMTMSASRLLEIFFLGGTPSAGRRGAATWAPPRCGYQQPPTEVLITNSRSTMANIRPVPKSHCRPSIRAESMQQGEANPPKSKMSAASLPLAPFHAA